jgi:hypothetical protein
LYLVGALAERTNQIQKRKTRAVIEGRAALEQMTAAKSNKATDVPTIE